MKCFSPALYLTFFVCYAYHPSMNIDSSTFPLYRARSVTYQLRLRLHYIDSLSCRREKLSGVKSIPFYPAPNALNNTHHKKQMQTSNGFHNTKKHPNSQATADNVFRPPR